MSKVITEITPLSNEDCFYYVDRMKSCFDYPLHVHEDIELNYLQDCPGARRVVGDSVELVGDYDLVLIGPGLEHYWDQHQCTSTKIREITMQFRHTSIDNGFLNKKQLKPITDLLELSRSGVVFGFDTVVKARILIEQMMSATGFYKVLKFIELLYVLGESKDYRVLASNTFAHIDNSTDSRRIHKIEDYVQQHFSEEIRLETVSALIYLSPTAFSRFFKLHTGRTFSDYVIEVRLGHAGRMLAESLKPIQEICYECGFNNISNFNRIFKRKRGFTPSEFREIYRKTKVIV